MSQHGFVIDNSRLGWVEGRRLGGQVDGYVHIAAGNGWRRERDERTGVRSGEVTRTHLPLGTRSCGQVQTCKWFTCERGRESEREREKA